MCKQCLECTDAVKPWVFLAKIKQLLSESLTLNLCNFLRKPLQGASFTLLLPGHGRAVWHHTVTIPVLGLHEHDCFKREMKRIDKSGVISFTEQMSFGCPPTALWDGYLDLLIMQISRQWQIFISLKQRQRKANSSLKKKLKVA